MSALVYYVEDDASIRGLVIYTLRTMGLQAEGFERPADFWPALEARQPDLILLDVMLPDEDGFFVLRRLKRTPGVMRIPVVMLTARDAEDDVVRGLEEGADDYLSKPFGVMELVARVKAVLRRCAASPTPSLLRVGGIEVDQERHTVRAQGEPVELTLKEYQLLTLLMRRPDHVFERQKLLGEVWGSDYIGSDHTLDAHMQTLRSKLGPCAGQIQTVYGRGYKIRSEEEAH